MRIPPRPYLGVISGMGQVIGLSFTAEGRRKRRTRRKKFKILNSKFQLRDEALMAG
jgi:hypothetical protein